MIYLLPTVLEGKVGAAVPWVLPLEMGHPNMDAAPHVLFTERCMYTAPPEH